MTSRLKGEGVLCDDSTKASVLKTLTMVEGGVVKLRDVIYGRPLSSEIFLF